MIFTRFITLILPSIATGLTYDTLQFSINYFQERNINFICSVTCEDNFMWDVEFTKAASARLMAVSALDVRRLSDHNIGQCVRRYYTSVGVVMNARCEAEQILNFASENMFLDSTHYWLIVDENENNIKNSSTNANLYENSLNSQKIIDILKDLNISVDADIILALKDLDKFILYDIFNFGKVQGGSLIINYTGFWSPNAGFHADLNTYKYYKRWDFGQWPMRIISVATFPRDQFHPEMLTKVRPVTGISTVTLTSSMCMIVVADIHNIRLVHSIADRWVGSLNKSYVDVAVISALHFRAQDIATVCRLYPSFNYEVITYIQPPVTYIETRYYYRIPTTGPGKFENQFFRPLSPGAWLGVLALCVMCSIVLLLAARLESRQGSVQYALFSVIASFCQQFFEDENPNIRLVSSARRQILFITGILCVLVYNYYTSSVVSWLLSGPPPSINSLEELLHSPLELVYQDVGYTRSWLYNPGYYFNIDNKKIEDALRRKVLNRKTSTPVQLPLEEGIALVNAGGYAYHAETYSANDLISRTFNQAELCELGSLTSMKKTALFPIAQKNSPYKEFLTWSVHRITERGIVSSIQRRTTPHPAICEGASPRALALGGAAPVFIMLALGYLTSLVILIFERFIYRFSERSPSKSGSTEFVN